MSGNGYIVKKGKIYLIEYGEPAAYRLYRETLDRGGKGLCISSEHPDTVKNEMEITTGETIWLSGEESNEKISPRDLENLRDGILKFVEDHGERGTILLDGLEYLITKNGFERTLKFFHDIREKIASKKATVIIPVSPPAFKERQIALLERYSEVMETVE